MILIFSAHGDPSTTEIINWLIYLDKKFVRINPNDQITLLSFELSNSSIDWTLKVNDTLVEYKEISFVWYRRGKITVEDFHLDLIKNNDVKQYLEKEIQIIENSIIYSLLNKPRIGDFKGTVNKLKTLMIAQSLGLKIPESSIATNKKMILNFEKNNRIVSKPIFEIVPFRDRQNKNVISAYTSRLDKDDIQDTFFYSLIQEEIEKEFEIRSFFFDNMFFSSAIFSQNNINTKLDFRNYDDNKPNRVIPYKLPEDIEIKLIQLMEKLQLNTGSFDLIYSKGKYVFIEVNPVGQFSMVSYPCNYYLEKIIVKKFVS